VASAHVLEQADQSDQAATLHLVKKASISWGHGAVLHKRSCMDALQGVPQKAGCVIIARVWRWTPPPQVTEQSDHAENGPCEQSMGQGWLLQV